MKSRVHVLGEVIAVLDGPSGRRVHRARNIVTDAGDLYYAQRAVNVLPTNFTTGAGVFDAIMELATDTGTPAKADNRSMVSGLIAGSGLAMDATYPKVNDLDVDNFGAGADIITYLATYPAGTATNGAIACVEITNPTPAAAESLLAYAKFDAAFAKAAADSLKVFLNHAITGV